MRDPVQETPAGARTELAQERTQLVNERTFSAWDRNRGDDCRAGSGPLSLYRGELPLSYAIGVIYILTGVGF
jgi:hypothetical protein